MAFITATQGTDVLSGLINLLSSPEAASAKLLEIKNAQDALDARSAEIQKLSNELTKQQTEFASKEAALVKATKDLAAAQTAVNEASRRSLADAAKVDASKKEVLNLGAKNLENTRVFTAKVRSQEAEFKLREKAIQDMLDKMTMTSRALDEREEVLKDREAAALELKTKYDSKLAQLKALS